MLRGDMRIRASALCRLAALTLLFQPFPARAQAQDAAQRSGPRAASGVSTPAAALERAERILESSLAAAEGWPAGERAAALASSGFSGPAANAPVVAAPGAGMPSARAAAPARARSPVPAFAAGPVLAEEDDKDKKPKPPDWDLGGTLWAGAAGLIGAAIGMAVGGPIGAIVGFLVAFFLGALLWRLFG